MLNLALKIEANNDLVFKGFATSLQEVQELMQSDQLDVAIVYEANYQQKLLSHQEPQIQLLTSSADPNRGVISANYITALLLQEQAEKAPFRITASTQMIFNPEMKSSHLFVPGIMGLVLMLIATLMTSVSIVREREKGTMEVLLASPLRPATMVVAKTVPYIFVSLLNLTTILLLSYFVLQVPIRGALITVVGISVLYILLSLSFGLLISNLSTLQINATIASAVSVMVPTLVLSGMIFPVENMPLFLQIFSYITPARWYISAIRKVMIQGLGLAAVTTEVAVLGGMTAFFLLLTIFTYKQRLE